MTEKDFKDAQQEMGHIVFEYEKFVKLGHITDLIYNYIYHELSMSCLKYDSENKAIFNVSKMLEAKESKENIEKFILESKTKYQQLHDFMTKKMEIAESIYSDITDKEKESKLDELYEKFCLENHPSVKLVVSKIETMAFNELRVFYLNNNLAAYVAKYEEYKNFFNPKDVEEKEYNNAINYFNSVKERIAKDIESRVDKYPHSKAEVFENEISVERERAELRIQHNKLRTTNSDFHNRIVKIYGEDIVF